MGLTLAWHTRNAMIMRLQPPGALVRLTIDIRKEVCHVYKYRWCNSSRGKISASVPKLPRDASILSLLLLPC